MKETNPFKPYISDEQLEALDITKSETLTASPLLNAVYEAFEKLGAKPSTSLGKYLNLDPKKISAALEIATGHSYSYIRNLWIEKRLAKLAEEHPDWGKDERAKAVGFANYIALWRMGHREKRKREYSRYKEYMNRPYYISR